MNRRGLPRRNDGWAGRKKEVGIRLERAEGFDAPCCRAVVAYWKGDGKRVTQVRPARESERSRRTFLTSHEAKDVHEQ